MIFKDVVQACLARRGIFTLTHIVEATGIERRRVRHYLERLKCEGHIARLSETEFTRRLVGGIRKEIHYTVRASLRDRLHGLENIPVSSEARDRIWRAIRHMRRFTKRELAVVTGVKLNSVNSFTRLLQQAGYIKHSGDSIWVLLKDNGPQRPSIKETKKRGDRRNNGHPATAGRG